MRYTSGGKRNTSQSWMWWLSTAIHRSASRACHRRQGGVQVAESSEEVLKQADIIFKVSQPLLDEVPWVVVTILGHKKKGWSGSAQVTKGSELSLQWMMICWFIVKGVGALGILGLSFGQKFGLKFTLIHIPCQQLQVSQGFRRFPKDSEARAAHIPNGGFHFFFPPWGADASGHTDVAELRLAQRHHFFGGMWISRWWLINSWTILGPKWTIFYGLVPWIKRRRRANESDASHPLVLDALQSMP